MPGGPADARNIQPENTCQKTLCPVHPTEVIQSAGKNPGLRVKMDPGKCGVESSPRPQQFAFLHELAPQQQPVYGRLLKFHIQ
jgi:hypothetical protein